MRLESEFLDALLDADVDAFTVVDALAVRWPPSEPSPVDPDARFLNE